jgi:uncharacterized membrane protein
MLACHSVVGLNAGLPHRTDCITVVSVVGFNAGLVLRTDCIAVVSVVGFNAGTQERLSLYPLWSSPSC